MTPRGRRLPTGITGSVEAISSEKDGCIHRAGQWVVCCIVMDDASAILALPDDPALLKQLLATRTRERDELQVAKLRLEVEILRLKKMYYGPRADRLQMPGDVAQLLLQFAQDMESQSV